MLKNYFTSRRINAYVSVLGTTQLHLRNPYVIAFWSAMFPGLGHLLLSKYLRGFLLFLWEVYVNFQGHINLCIFYSFTGDFEAAKAVLDTRWMLLYIPTYFFGIWDSYRTTVDLNNQYLLSAREDAAIKPFKMNAIEINYLDKKAPWSSVLWSFIMPGTGQLAIHRIVVAFFTIAWWIVIINYSNVLPAIHSAFMGDFEQSKYLLNVHWFMNIPSVYYFAIYDAYINTVESNKLFDWEQAKFLNRDYLNLSFPVPLSKTLRSGHMYIVSTFKHSIALEKAITSMQMMGVMKDSIFALSLDKRGEKLKLFDTMDRSDGLSLFDVAFIMGSAFSLLGAIYGFLLAWGPLIWGLIGFAAGAVLGLAVKLFYTRKYLFNRMKDNETEVVLIVECKEHELEKVKDLLWAHNALGVRKLSSQDKDIEGVQCFS